MTTTIEKIFKFYLEILKEFDIKNTIHLTSREDDFFEEAFEEAFGFYPFDSEKDEPEEDEI